MKKKIAFLINSMDCGGAQRVISRLLGPLSEKYDISLLMLNETEEAYDICVPKVYFSGKEKANRLAYYLELSKTGKKLNTYIKDNNIQAVVSFLSVPNLANIIFCKHVKKIISIRADMNYFDNYTLSNKISYNICKLLFKKTDKAIVPSAVLKEQLFSDFKVPKEDIEVVYNPFDIIDIAQKAKEEVRLFGDKENDSSDYIVAMGRLDRQKGFYHLIKSFSLLQDRDIKLVIMGDGELRSSLTNLANKLGVQDRILFTGIQKNPFSIIKDAKLYVMSSLAEGFPNALVEAMACGVPVISTDCVSGPREILYDNPDINKKAQNIEYADYGVLVPEFINQEDSNANDGQYQLMSKAIEKLLVDEELREKYSQKSIERASRFTLDNSVQGFVDVIESCLM